MLLLTWKYSGISTAQTASPGNKQIHILDSKMTLFFRKLSLSFVNGVYELVKKHCRRFQKNTAWFIYNVLEKIFGSYSTHINKFQHTNIVNQLKTAVGKNCEVMTFGHKISDLL